MKALVKEAFFAYNVFNGDIAQLGEHLLDV